MYKFDGRNGNEGEVLEKRCTSNRDIWSNSVFGSVLLYGGRSDRMVSIGNGCWYSYGDSIYVSYSANALKSIWNCWNGSDVCYDWWIIWKYYRRIHTD